MAGLEVRAGAVEGNEGAPILGPHNPARETENPDRIAPPPTDQGSLPSLRFCFAAAHLKMRDGGWSRQVTQHELPVAAGGVREPHWHKEAEWSYMLAAGARITALDTDGRNFVADVGPGDLWYFLEGLPHSIQGLGPRGCEFLLAFTSGCFSEDRHLRDDRHVHMPKAALAKLRRRPAGVRSHSEIGAFHFRADPPAAVAE